MYSVGPLYAVQQFLALLQGHSGPVAFRDLKALRSYGGLSFDRIRAALQHYNWIEIDIEGLVRTSDCGIRIVDVSKTSMEIALAEQISQMVRVDSPDWLGLARSGLQALSLYAPPSVKQCLREAGFFSADVSPLASQWLTMSQLAWRQADESRAKVGMEAERLSLKFEHSRTGVPATWLSPRTSEAGFDILSVVDAPLSDPLRVEVKGSRQSIESASFFVTAREWTTASGDLPYVFHLWDLSRPERPFIVSPADIEPHVARNRGNGNWTTVEIPFRSVVSVD